MMTAAYAWTFVFLGLETPQTEEELYAAVPVTPEGAFTEGIEGPACDRGGNVFADP